MPILTWLLVVIVCLGLAYGTASAFGARRWSGATSDLVARLTLGGANPAINRYHETELADLPAPVQHYFRAVLTDGQPIVTAARLTQSGQFNMGAMADQWKPFTATQHFTTARPDFVWDANITLFPGVPVRGVDAFIAAEGLLRPTILGLYEMGTLQGTGDLSGAPLPALQLLPVSTIVPPFAMFFIGAVGEELGWQGYACPALAKHHSALTAALVIGMVWALWHVIPFALMGRGAGWIFWHSLAIVLIRVIIVWLFATTGQRILIPVLFHVMSNSVWGLFADFAPYCHPVFMCLVLLVAVAAILWLWRPDMCLRNRYPAL